MPFLAQQHVPISNKDILSWIFDDQKYDADKPVYIDAVKPSRSLSSRQSQSMIRKLIAGFRAAGFRKGDCVCIHSFNDLYYPILVLGIIAAGGVYTGTNPSYTPFELSHHLKTAKAKFIVTEPELLDNITVAAQERGIPESNLWIFDVHGQSIPQGCRSWTELMKHGEQDWVRFDDETTSMQTTAALLFSSGTTGLPKAAVISHYNLVAQHTVAIEPANVPYEVSRMIYLPMFHAAVVPLGHTSALKDGSKTYIMRRFDIEIFLQSVSRYKITELVVVPPIVLAVLASPLTKKYDLTSVMSTLCGAAALGKTHQRQFELLLNEKASFNQVWGMTETTCVASRFWYPEDDQTGSIGRFVANLDVKLVDDDDNDITALGGKGEILVRGPTVISGYYENPSANAASFDSEGYFRTGDIVVCEDGPGLTPSTAKWYIVDRKKELIKVRGFQVSPAELEAVILQHPQIVDAAVIGVRDPNSKDGEQPRGYVVRGSANPDEKLTVTEAEVRDWCAQRLAKYKALSGGIVFVDAVPRNAGGKLLKRILREQAEAEAASTSSRAKL